MENPHLHDLFVDELKDILGAEKQLLKGLQKMKKAANSSQLQTAFENHYTETESQIEKLKDVLKSIDLYPRGKKCKAMEGLLSEGDEIIEEYQDDPACDAALITAAQKIEHYEIATYGCLVTFAKLMKHKKAEKLLQEILDQEKATDVKLTEIAMSEANMA